MHCARRDTTTAQRYTSRCAEAIWHKDSFARACVATKLKPMNRYSLSDVPKTPELLELVIANDASVRIQNALKHAYRSGILSIFTRDEYLSKAVYGVPLAFHGIPNLGRKSLAELDDIVRTNAMPTCLLGNAHSSFTEDAEPVPPVRLAVVEPISV